MFHLSLAAALFAIVFGNLFGAIFMALHAAQGPHLGVPQMVQTRGQFGARGALAVIAFVAVMDVGFFASNLVLSAQSLHRALPGAAARARGRRGSRCSARWRAMFGHDLIHAFTRAMSWLCGGGASPPASRGCCGTHPWAAIALGPATTMPALLGAISTSVLWQIAYAPYVSDYSRYLPPGTGRARRLLGELLGLRDWARSRRWRSARCSAACFPAQDISASFRRRDRAGRPGSRSPR